MTDINSVTLVGNATFDPRLDYLKGSNTAKLTVSIASNRSVKRGDKWESEVSFFEVVYFGKAAEAIKPYIAKGKKIAVQGKLQQDRWEKDGVKNSRVYVVADTVQLLGGGTTQPAPANSTPQQAIEMPPMDNAFPEDMPF